MMLALLLGLSFNTWAQTMEVSGVVLDDQKMGIPGASVIIKGTTTGTATDIDGKFFINVDKGQVLVISFVGFKSQELTMDGKTHFDVVLENSAIGLDEVVAIGYGAVKKSDLTGSVASLDSDKLTEMRKTDVGQAIQGQIAGVDVRRVSSKPGAPLSIKIRGNTVITNTNVDNDGVTNDLSRDLSKPLYVVDGIFLDDISIIDPSNIKKMDILKDASATAIYGSRGANGVVIVTTKSGIEGKTVFTYDGSFGITSAVNRPDMMDGDEYVQFVKDGVRGKKWRTLWETENPLAEDFDNIDITEELESQFRSSNGETDNIANKRYTDWTKEFLNTAIQTSHSVGMSGGQNGMVYNASIGYLKDEGVIGIEKYERYTAAVSLSKKVTDQITVGIRTNLAYSEREEGSRELWRSLHRMAPTVSPYDENGDPVLFPDDQESRFLNPYYDANGSWEVNTRRTDVIANFYVDYKPVEWFSFKSTFAPNLRTIRLGEYRSLKTKAARNQQSRTRSIYNTMFDNSYSWDNIANFDFKPFEDHKLKATLISSLYYNQIEGSNIQVRNLDSDSYSFYNTAGGDDVRERDSYYTKQTLASFAARVNYNIKEKYLFTFTGRYDGSSKLAEGEKWTFFPSAAFAWRVSEEDFMQDFSWLDNLKVRLSYGEAGNDAPVKPYASMAFLSNSGYLFGNSTATGKTVENLSNEKLTWERSKEYNFGLNIGILNNRVRLDAELYQKDTDGGILNRELMYITGYSSAVGNYGELRNKGIELVLNTVNVRTDDFSWETSINFAKNKNEILKLADGVDQFLYGKYGILRVGESVDAIYGYEKDGIWQMSEAAEAKTYGAVPGMYKIVDQDGDGAITGDKDKVVLGSNSPDWIGGITNNFRYKDFDMNVMVYTRQGAYGHSEFYEHHSPEDTNTSFNRVDRNYWTPTNQNGDVQLPGIRPSYGNTFFTEMSFVKVGNIGLGYNVPKSILNKWNISKVRLSLDVQNPFTFSDYKGPDPETGLQNSYNMGYSLKTVLFGLKVTL